MYVEPSYFLIFQNILGTKNFRNRMNFFSSSANYYFLHKVRYIQWNVVNFDLETISSKNSWFLFLDKSQVQKSVDVITCFSCTVKKQKFKGIQAHSWIPLFPMLSFSKCLVCVCVLFIYTISISIICASQEELSLIASNEQIYDFHNWVIFLTEKTLQIVKFW